ncbi:MAG: bifunctional amino acid transporter/iron-containing alcohol dehydrogenase [Pseudomonadota bacterium]
MQVTKKSDFNKVFSKWDILMIAFGAMIGWGWVVASGGWIATGGVIGAMIGFILGGTMVFFVGLTYAELTTAMPQCGGEHVFSYKALGPVGSFICTWMIILGYLGVVCFEACALPTIMTYLYPDFLQGYLYTIAGFKVYASWLAVAILVSIAVTAINIIGAKPAAILQTILTVFIAGAGVALIAASVINGSTTNLEGQVFATAADAAGDSGLALKGIIYVAVMTPFFFIGFDVIPQAAEEINVPLKQIGRILVLSIVMAVVFYALIIFGVGYIMPAADIKASQAATGLVTADAMAAAFNSSVMAKVMIVGGMCGIITSWNSFLIGGSRAMYAMADTYMIPRVFAKLHPKYKTPTAALYLMGILSVLAPFCGRTMMVWMVDAGNFGCCVAYAMVALSFLILRKKAPDMPRPYKVQYPTFVGVTAILMSMFMVVMYVIPGSAAALTPEEWVFVGGWIALGACFFFFCKAKYGDKFASHIDVQNDELHGMQTTAMAAAPAAKTAAAPVAKQRTPAPAMAFDFCLPVNIVFGAGKVAQVGALTKPYGQKALIVTGANSAKASGLYDRVKADLEAAGIATVLFDKVTQNPLTTTANEGAAFANANACDVIVAIGGGSVVDCAKAMAFLAKNEGDVIDYIYNGKTGTEALPVVAIPTTCGTGTEANGFAVLTNPVSSDKKGLRCSAIIPKVSIVDPTCMMTMPPKVLAIVGFDALCHCIESYTSKTAQPITDALCLYGIELLADNLVSVYKGDADMAAWERITLASTLGGMAINQTGVGLAHGMEHPVSGLKDDVAHGLGLAALAPVALEASLAGNHFKFAQVARLLGGTTAADLPNCIRTILADLDMTVTLNSLGITHVDASWMAENCMKVSAAAVANNPVVFTQEQIAELYTKCM